MSRHHELKTHPEFFEAVLCGSKTFEVRQNDRGFTQGDTVTLYEFRPDRGAYTGRQATFAIGHVYDGTPLHDLGELVVFSLLPSGGS